MKAVSELERATSGQGGTNECDQNVATLRCGSTSADDTVTTWRSQAQQAFILLRALGLALVLLSSGVSFGYSLEEIRAVETQKEKKIRQLREQEVKQLSLALDRRLPKNRMAELFFRMAEIHVESYRHTFLLEGRVFEKRLAVNRGGRGIDRSNSKPYLARALKACQNVIDLKIPFDKMDRIYYFLAFNYGELGQSEKSVKYFKILTAEYPSSVFATEAYRELADRAFDRGDFREAQGFYEAAIRNGKDSAILPAIYHKLAWCFYRTRRYDEAIDKMKEAIRLIVAEGERYLSLREEALRDMAIFMTERGRAAEAIEFFEKVAGSKDFYARALEGLGREYERQVKIDKAIQVYETLMSARPGDEAAFRVLVKLVELDLKGNHHAKALQRLQKAEFLETGEPATEKAYKSLKALVRRTATERHDHFRKKADKNALAVAEGYYDLYLTRFLKSDEFKNERVEIQMYLAEVKRELGKPDQSSELYRTVLKSHDNRFKDSAASLWVESLSEQIKKEAARSGSKVREGEPSQVEKEFVIASDELSTSLPDSKQTRESALRSAQIAAGYETTRAESVTRIKNILKKWPSSSQAVVASQLWIQIETDRLPKPGTVSVEEYAKASSPLANAVTTIRENEEILKADRQYNKGKLATSLASLEQRMRIERIALLEGEQKFDQAAKNYETYASLTTNSAEKETALQSASASYLKAKDYKELARVTREWVTKFPRSKKALDSMRVNATALFVEGEFDLSAQLFEGLGEAVGDASAFGTAARIWKGTGDFSEAFRSWKDYIKKYPKGATRWAVALEMAETYEKEGQLQGAKQYYEYCAAGPLMFVAECKSRLADVHARESDLDSAVKLYQQVGRLSGNKEARSPYIAYALFRIAEIQEKSGKFDRLELPEPRLRRGLQQRLRFFEGLTRSYLNAVSAGGPWAIAALHRLAAWTADFAKEVESIEAPKGSSDQAREAFKKTLSSISGPLTQKAIDTWKRAHKTANESAVLSADLPLISDALADYRVRNVYRAQGYRGRYRLFGVPADGGKNGKEQAIATVRAGLLKNPSQSELWVDYGNLLWGLRKIGLAEIAYERAAQLDGKNAAAFNNRGVVVISCGSEDVWASVLKAYEWFQASQKSDRDFVAAKLNLAILFNYYRLFAQSKPLWDDVVAKVKHSDVFDGLGIATFGVGRIAMAEKPFEQADQLDARTTRFARLYHDAVKDSTQGAEGAKECLSQLSDIDRKDLAGFEALAVKHLENTCKEWKASQENST